MCISLLRRPRRLRAPPAPSMAAAAFPGGIAARWRELHGASEWRGLLEPSPDTDLRLAVINYGELSQATIDGFIRERYSPFAGASRFTRHGFLDKVEVSHPELYTVTAFIYATAGVDPGKPSPFVLRSLSREAWSKESNWMGFVAVATDEGKAALGRRDVVVAWRGTIQPLEWVDNFAFRLVSPTPVLAAGDGTAKVHDGFMMIYTSSDPMSRYCKRSAREQVLEEVKRLVEQYKDEEMSITITGHSLGASLAILNATDIAANAINKPSSSSPIPVTAIAFGCPHVGNPAFKRAFDALAPGLRVLRIRNTPDIIPDYPPIGYVPVGAELRIDTRLSPFLKKPGDSNSWHNLQCMLHGIAGVQGKGKFQLVVERDVELVNKHIDALKDEMHIPPLWGVAKNKGMERDHNGHWRLMDHEDDEDEYV